MKSPFHHIKHPESLIENFHKKIHHAFAIIALAIIGMLRWASNILSQTSASWQWWGFLTNDFWDQSPTNANIMYALFGDGTPGATAYTRLWTGSCIPTNIVTLSTGFAWFTWAANTIYILNAGSYTLTTPIVLNGNCSAFLGKGDVFIKPGNSTISPVIVDTNKDKTIIDNIKINGNWAATWVDISSTTNNSINNITVTNTIWWGIVSFWWSAINSISNSRIYNNVIWAIWAYFNINNSLIYNNTGGIRAIALSLSNSQVFNNTIWMDGPWWWFPSIIYWAINNSVFYNNNIGLHISDSIMNNVSFYNNDTGLDTFPWGYATGYWLLRFFNNTTDISTGTIVFDSIIPVSSRTEGSLDTWSVSLDYERFTNPQNGSGQYLLSWTTLSSLRGTQSTFNQNKNPIRYIFGWNILKQIAPIVFDGSTLIEYPDYIASRYIAEPDSTLPIDQQLLVNQYFWSWSTFTQNWQTNWCSLSAFLVKTLTPGSFTTANNKFEDHTIYLLTGGEYRSAITSSTGNGFVFNGNCIALIGNNDTRFTKSSTVGISNMLYASNKRNIIIDSIKVDGLFYSTMLSSPKAQIAIKFDGTTNNNTINNAQVYNNSLYGIYLGLGSHHTTIINTQAFNNSAAGIHLYYASNYNVINNTQTYNNGSYGIWFANGSNRNTMNNFQSYNNMIGVFWDLTTQENIINRAAIYNNSDAGIYLKNASGNVLNDVKIYHNGVGIQTLYNSVGNKFYWELKLFDNTWGNLDGTNANDSFLSAGAAGLFAYAGVLSTGDTTMSCLDASNPTLSGNWATLLGTYCNDIWYVSAFESSYNTYVNYAFGLSMYKQKVPVRYDAGNALVQIPSQYNASKYIAEIFAIWDDTPEAVSFVWSGTAELNSWYTTNVYTAGTINTPVLVTLSFNPSTSSGYLTISGSNFGLTWLANNWDTIRINVLTRTGYNQTITGTITIWSVTTWFSVTTRNFIQTPTSWSFTFSSLTSVPLNTLTGSTITVSGLETGVLSSITFDPTSASGRLEIYSGTTLINSWTAGLLVYNGNQIKALVLSTSWYTQTITWYVTIGLWTWMFTITTKWSDVTPPTAPILTYPLSGEEMFFITFEWNASVDTWSWLAWYAYEIADDSNFSSIVNTWFISTTTDTMGVPRTNFSTITNRYYLRIRGKDRDGNYSSRSNNGYFKAINSTGRHLTGINNANLSTQYDSSTIILDGIKPGLMIWASTDANATLSKNGSNRGTGTFVQNGDTIGMTVRSSSIYSRTITWVLTLANRTLAFGVTTKPWTGCSLSDTQMLATQSIFNELVQNYTGDLSRFNEFLYTMQSMLTDQIGFTHDCNLEYLATLISWAIGGNIAVNTWVHTAPNCKQYPVSFDNTKLAYTSPTFRVITYFANRDSLTRYIDSKNPGDCHINTYSNSSLMFTNANPNRHIAPNGKVYTIQYGSQWYSSTEFTVNRYFSSIAELRNFIDNNNIPQAIRSHQIDVTFTPQTYTTPNGKDYIIYRTDRWYMSYKLMKVRYFSTLTEIQTFIRNNNK